MDETLSLPTQSFDIQDQLTVMGVLCRKDRCGLRYKSTGVDTSGPRAYVVPATAEERRRDVGCI